MTEPQPSPERATLSPALREQIEDALKAKNRGHALKLYANQRDYAGTDYPVLLLTDVCEVVAGIALLAKAEGQQAELARCVERAAAHYAFGLRAELAQRLEELQR